MYEPSNFQPKTISELQKVCEDLKLPLYTLHIALNINTNMPKMFGIYKEEPTGDIVVYKNKSDGTRAERYRGDDEAYAVNEMWLKIQEICDLSHKPKEKPPAELGIPKPDVNQKPIQESTPPEPESLPEPAYDPPADGIPPVNPYRREPYPPSCVGYSSYPPRRRRQRHSLLHIISVLIIIITLFSMIGTVVLLSKSSPGFSGSHHGFHPNPSYQQGYYDIDGSHYFYYPSLNEWYAYDEYYDDWYPYVMPEQVPGYYDDYYIDDYWAYDRDYGFQNWYDDYYDTQDPYDVWDWDYDNDTDDSWDYNYDDSWDSDYDSDYDWDSDWDSDYDWDDDWDSGSDWDSDWDSDYDWDSDW